MSVPAPAPSQRRLLFVDDEPDVLDGLRDALRRQRHRWDMTFLTSPYDAVDLVIEGDPFDVVVSDMRMPGMDGAELLSRVQEAQPTAVRVVLSGHAEAEAALRAALVAHLFLAKPCDPDVLRHTLERCCGMAAVLEDVELRGATGSVGALPPAPSIYRELTVALSNPEVGARAVSAIIARDPALCAKVLQLVNSAFYGLGRRISSTDEAVSYLGVSTVRSLAVALSAFASFEGSQEHLLEELHRHSMLTANLAAQLVGRAAERDDAFLAGMLHDVGKLVLDLHDSSYLAGVEREARETGGEPVEVERSIRGCTHADVGAYLLALWGLPIEIVEAVALHHGPVEIEDALSLPNAVRIADLLAGERAGVSEIASRALSQLDPARVAAWRALLDQEDTNMNGTGGHP